MNTDNDNDDVELRSKDIAILQAIHNGATDTAEIKNATTLTNREINYSLTEYSLEQQDLVNVHRPSTQRETRTVDNTEREIWTPKNVELTDKALQTLNQNPDQTPYQDMTHRELIQQIHELENRVNQLETVLKNFRNKVMEQL